MKHNIYYGIYFAAKKINVNSKLTLFINDVNLLIGKNIHVGVSKELEGIIISYIENNLESKNKYMLEVEVDISDNEQIKYYIGSKIYNSILDIIDKYNVFPQIFIEPIDIDTYKHQLAQLGLKKDNIFCKEKQKIDNVVNKKFNVINGLNDIYEHYTGAIYFKDNEWCQIRNNSIKNLFETKENCSYKYMLPLDDGNILRGADVYYFFSSDVNKYIGPTKKQISKWSDNSYIFLQDCISALSNFKIRDSYDLRLLLAIIDNIRNLVLLLINVRTLINYRFESFIIGIDTMEKDTYLAPLIALVYDYQNLIYDICLKEETGNGFVERVTNMCIKLSQIFKDIIIPVYNIDDQYIINKCFNPLREIDNYFENYIVMNYVSKIIEKEHSTLVGILYGGLELPFILNFLLKNNCKISFIYQNKGMYLDRQACSKNECYFNMKNLGNIDYSLTTNYLMDDNIMSGVTAQHIINELFGIGCEIKGQIVVRHANINRLPQLKHFDCGADLSLVDSFYLGMLTNTPYSKIKYNTNYDNMFVNELNIFSIMTEVFLKALYINNSFVKNSEVDIFNGYSTGRPLLDDVVLYSEDYYNRIISQNGYSPIDRITRDIFELSNMELHERWLCGLNLNRFIDLLNKNEKTIVIMGIGINGTPHIGTLSQILKCIRLQQIGLDVQIILGDLDVYNARAQNIEDITNLANKYKQFIIELGFDITKGEIRSQYNSDAVSKTACLIAPFIDDDEFLELEEDIYALYKAENKYQGMTFCVKESILLMFADFIHLGLCGDYKNILVLSGIDEHVYVKKAAEIVKKMNLNINMGGLFSRIIKAINDYPKMSKSLQGSSIDLDINQTDLENFIRNTDDDNFVYELMLNSTKYDIEKLLYLKNVKELNKNEWKRAKEDYIGDFMKICEKWRKL